MTLLENIPLAALTTLKVGGRARYLVEADSEQEIIEAVDRARSAQWPLLVLGGGSNLLVADAGWPGLALKVAIKGIETMDGGGDISNKVTNGDTDSEGGGKREFLVGAGEEWDAFVAHAVAQNCAGIETLSGIPGTVGGTPVQNVGAYGQEVSESIRSVRVLDLETMRIHEMSNSECGFSYRTSIFNSTQRNRYIVLKVRFDLTVSGRPRIAYGDLQRYFAKQLKSGSGDTLPTLEQTRAAVREIRRSKAMLIVPDDEDCRSAGSFFKNPIVPMTKYDEVSALAGDAGGPPRFPASAGQVKIPAAWLVEQSGFNKGYSRGSVGISRKHSLAIINRGGATAAEIVALKDAVQKAVREKFGIELQPEPVFIGF